MEWFQAVNTWDIQVSESGPMGWEHNSTWDSDVVFLRPGVRDSTVCRQMQAVPKFLSCPGRENMGRRAKRPEPNLYKRNIIIQVCFNFGKIQRLEPLIVGNSSQ